jgi:tight adherence protein B
MWILERLLPLKNLTSSQQPMLAASAVRQVVALVGAGLPANQAKNMTQEKIHQFSPQQAQQFDFIWGLAFQIGGPVTLTLERLADVFDRQQKNLSEIQLAFAGPQATAKLVSWLPLAALALAQLVGMNPLAAVTGSTAGLVSVLLGLGLLAVGQRWSKRLLEQANSKALDPGAFIDAVLVGLQGGLPLRKSETAAKEHFKIVFQQEVPEKDLALIKSVAELARDSGAALTKILAAEADRLREEERYQISEQIARLGIRLMIPLGVAVLPAFILIAIVPIALSLLSNGQL